MIGKHQLLHFVAPAARHLAIRGQRLVRRWTLAERNHIVGAYTLGMMGRTPNIDSIGQQGMIFTDHYGQPSCTAGRAAFIMGQLPVRTGMTTIGIPGSRRGIQKADPTLAEVLKIQGYATGQFGKVGRVRKLEVPVANAMAAMTRLGLGLEELLPADVDAKSMWRGS